LKILNYKFKPFFSFYSYGKLLQIVRNRTWRFVICFFEKFNRGKKKESIYLDYKQWYTKTNECINTSQYYLPGKIYRKTSQTFPRPKENSIFIIKNFRTREIWIIYIKSKIRNQLNDFKKRILTKTNSNVRRKNDCYHDRL